jgi:hypothetical protein
MNKKIVDLIKLLDDENQQSASIVMAELLCYESELDSVIQDLQESENIKLRRRIHQLQSILSTRRNRQSLAKRLGNKQTDLFDTLAELHFQWYDNDTKNTISQYWEALLENSKKYQPTTIEKLGCFMRKYGFRTSSKGNIEADFLCIGIVLEELVGADFIMCAIAQKLAIHWGLKLDIIYLIGDFALIDPKDQVLFPKNFWKLIPKIKKATFQKWDNKMILRMATSMLYLCAIATDSFRYVHSIGKCLANSSDIENLSALPYPYNLDT